MSSTDFVGHAKAQRPLVVGRMEDSGSKRGTDSSEKAKDVPPTRISPSITALRRRKLEGLDGRRYLALSSLLTFVVRSSRAPARQSYLLSVPG